MGYLFGVVTVFIWAGNSIVCKLSSGAILPGAMSFYRWFFAVLLLTPFCLPSVFRNMATIRTYWKHLAALGVLGMVISQTLGYFAAATTSVTHMALITALIPVLSLLLSVPFLAQPLYFNALIGMMLSFSGLVFMITHGDISILLAGGVSLGDGLVLIGAFSYALYSVLLKKWSIPLTTWNSIYMQGVFALIILLPLLVFGGSYEISKGAAPLVAYAALLASVLAPWLWINAIGLLGASRTTILMNLLPLLSAFLARFILKETLTLYHYLGGGMVIMGVAVIQVKSSFMKNVLTALFRRKAIIKGVAGSHGGIKKNSAW